MYIQGKDSRFKNIDFLLVDLFAMLVSFVVAFFIKFGTLDFAFGTVWLKMLVLVIGFDVIVSVMLNPYNEIFKRPYYMEIVRALQLTFFNMIAVTLILYVFKVGATYSRAVYIMTYAFYFVVSVVFKYIWKKLQVSGIIKIHKIKSIPLFVVTELKNVEKVLINVSAGDFDIFDIKGLHFTDDDKNEKYDGIPVVREGFANYVVKNNITDVLIAMNPAEVSQGDYDKLIHNAVNIHVSIEDVIGMQTEHQYVGELGVYSTLNVGTFSFRPSQVAYLAVKRVLEIVFGVVGVVLLLPISLVVKLSYLISGDKAGILFKQDRVGKNGKPISIYKFRTMTINADEMLDEMLKDDKLREEWESNQKFENDPRITKVGRVLRKLSIDEFPQVINVLAGSMSFVGPRPLVEGELEAHDGLKLYQRVKPGMTGWWGCNGRSNMEYRERLELEYYYVKHFSIYLDMLCVFRTIVEVIRGNGAR